MKFALLLAGLILLTGIGVLVIDRGLPARLRDILSASRPRLQEWVEGATEFAQSTRSNVEVTSGENGGLTLHPGASQGQYLSPVHSFAADWNALGIEWRSQIPAATHIRLQLHYSADGRSWSDWVQVEADEDLAAEGVNYGRLIFTPAARYVQYRANLDTGNLLVAPFLHRLRFTALDTRTVSAIPTVKPRDPDGPRILSRAEWGADESLMARVPEYQKPFKIILHDVANAPTGAESAAAVRALYLYHAVVRGWGDLGYNYLIDPNGTIYEGRAGGENVTGFHARQYSYGSIGIGLMGDYDREPMSAAMRDSLVALLAFLGDHYGIDPRGSANFYDLANVPNVLSHQDVAAVTDAGQFVASALPEIRAAALEKMRAFPPKLTQYGAPPDKPISGRKAIVIIGEPLLTSQVEFYVDDKLQAVAQEPTGGNQFTWDWDTTRFADGSHIVKVIARGTNKNDSTIRTTYLVDNTGPKGQLVINSGAQYTRVPTLTLSITATDVSKVATMQFVDPAGTPLSEAEPFATSRTVVLRPGEGPRLVALQFTDSLGNRSPVQSASIFLDTEPPVDWRDSNPDSNHASISVTDRGSGVNLAGVRYAVSEDQVTWSDWLPAHGEWDGKGATARIGAPGAVSQKWIRFLAEDFAGNVSESAPMALNFQIAASTANPANTVTARLAGGTTRTPTPPLGTSTPGGTRPSSAAVTQTIPAGAAQKPDLTIELVQVQPAEIESNGPATFIVTLRNQGGLTKKGFWVALWIDPIQPPGINAADPSRDNLAMWYVAGMGAGEILALTSTSPYQPYTTFSGRLAGGTHRVFAMVDAINTESRAGLVLESNEENNLSGPLEVSVTRGPSSWSDTLWNAAMGLWEQVRK